MEQSFGSLIAELRKKQNMTQQDLANKLNITGKAVSKWERGLSYPDITSISKIANILEVDPSRLISTCKKEDNPFQKGPKENIKALLVFVFNAIGIAMGITILLIPALDEVELKTMYSLIGLGITCLSISVLMSHTKSE